MPKHGSSGGQRTSFVWPRASMGASQPEIDCWKGRGERGETDENQTASLGVRSSWKTI
jgi:hypothetical protein